MSRERGIQRKQTSTPLAKGYGTPRALVGVGKTAAPTHNPETLRPQKIDPQLQPKIKQTPRPVREVTHMTPQTLFTPTSIWSRRNLFQSTLQSTSVLPLETVGKDAGLEA